MENKTFYNGVNFTRALLAGACNLDEVGTLGQLMVLENLIGPMIGQLYDMSDMIPINGLSDAVEGGRDGYRAAACCAAPGERV